MTQFFEQIEMGFKQGDIDYLDAIAMLQKDGYEPFAPPPTEETEIDQRAAQHGD